MINLKKKKIGKVSALSLLRGPAPAPYFHPLFLIFQIPPSGRGNHNLLLPFWGPNYAFLNTLSHLANFASMFRFI